MKATSKTLDIAGKTLTLQTGLLAEQATSAVLARMGDTMVLATVVMGQKDTTLGYFPLSVEYVERLYAGGRIKGSRWVKREGRPSDDAVLTGRLIDRSIRPLFPKELKKDIQVVVTVLSVDGQNSPDILGMIATSAALATSKIPWNGPVGATRAGIFSSAVTPEGTEDKGKEGIVINPESGEKQLLDLDVVVTSKGDLTLMLEAGAKQVPEEKAAEAIQEAVAWNKKIIGLIEEMVAEVGEKKETVQKNAQLEEAIMLVEKSYKEDVIALMEGGVSREVGSGIDELAAKILEADEELDSSLVKTAVDYVFKKTIRQRILKDGTRPDGRPVDQVRPISAMVGVLPRTHGSAIFSRGETQALTVATLGPSTMEQLIEGPEGEESKRYMHHYSFPPYSVGETGRIGTPSRREIGHGALAERALEAVLPPESEFPYAIRLVSEVMSSNGSTSMASTCGSTLALMDAGVPIIEPVAGIAIGLMTDTEKKTDKYVLLTDIIGLEDFSGDMDFKVTGTKNGITAIQLDVKIDGLTDQMIKETFDLAKKARLSILEKMKEVLPETRTTVSQYAPKIKVIKIDVEKIGEVIGSGGKVIRNIISTTGASVDVEEDGSVAISAVDEVAVEKAAEWVSLLTRDIQKGEVFEGKVKRILPFGAMVELVPGKEGLVHVSEMSTEYVNSPEDVVQIGQTVKVRVKEKDDQGRYNLSMVFGERSERPGGGERGGDRGGSRGPDRGPRGGGYGRRDDRRDAGGPHRSRDPWGSDKLDIRTRTGNDSYRGGRRDRRDR